jgi:catechol 2,3-dioxygenase-like lactoylglutathione lyase family enzyme
MIKGLHHNAYRCRDSEETRKFYEDFLGLPLAHALLIAETKTGREAKVLHLAFFEAPADAYRFGS